MTFLGVSVTFLSPSEPPYEYVGNIRLGDSEMVIDLPRGEVRAYLVRGRLVNGFFAGRDEIADDGAPLNIVARWTELGDVWVGWWREKGVEYLFTFRLPKTSASSTAAESHARPSSE